MTYLLDINVLVCLFDGSHVNHEAAHAWFGRSGRRSWATCPITENGCLRVLSSLAYPSVQATPKEVAERLARLCAQPGHEFWPDDVSLSAAMDDATRARLTGAQQITESTTDAWQLSTARSSNHFKAPRWRQRSNCCADSGDPLEMARRGRGALSLERDDRRVLC